MRNIRKCYKVYRFLTLNYYETTQYEILPRRKNFWDNFLF